MHLTSAVEGESGTERTGKRERRSPSKRGGGRIASGEEKVDCFHKFSDLNRLLPANASPGRKKGGSPVRLGFG